jgi:hypothetical protein
MGGDALSEYPDVYDERHIAHCQKEHKCCECSGIINQGESYQRIWYIFDGHSYTHKTCPICKEIRNEFNKRQDDQEDWAPVEMLCSTLLESDEDDLKRRFDDLWKKVHGYSILKETQSE